MEQVRLLLWAGVVLGMGTTVCVCVYVCVTSLVPPTTTTTTRNLDYVKSCPFKSTECPSPLKGQIIPALTQLFICPGSC